VCHAADSIPVGATKDCDVAPPRGVTDHTLAKEEAIDLTTASPSALPRRASEHRSGWGIMPRTLRSRLQMPAMLRAEPFGFADRRTLPSSSQYRNTTCP